MGEMIPKEDLIRSVIGATICMIVLIETPITSPEGKRTLLDHLNKRLGSYREELAIISDPPIEYWRECESELLSDK